MSLLSHQNSVAVKVGWADKSELTQLQEVEHSLLNKMIVRWGWDGVAESELHSEEI